MLRCWHLVRILVRTDHPCLGVGCHTHPPLHHQIRNTLHRMLLNLASLNSASPDPQYPTSASVGSGMARMVVSVVLLIASVVVMFVSPPPLLPSPNVAATFTAPVCQVLRPTVLQQRLENILFYSYPKIIIEQYSKLLICPYQLTVRLKNNIFVH
jgi:hypothetical protein